MMNKKTKALVASLVLGMMVSVAPSSAMALGSGKYTVLGDSIAFGWGASWFYGYANDYSDNFLEGTKYSYVNFMQKSFPGHKTSDMLSLLKTDTGIRDSVRTSTELTISIGGNNLLGCASNNYGTVNLTCAEQGVQNFAVEYPAILKEIRNNIGSKGHMTVMTLYNPYRGDEALFATVDPYIKRLNAIITNATNKSTYNYKVADTYTDFLGKAADGTWKVSNWTHFSESTRDPHPTNAGHKEISRLHKLVY